MTSSAMLNYRPFMEVISYQLLAGILFYFTSFALTVVILQTKHSVQQPLDRESVDLSGKVQVAF